MKKLDLMKAYSKYYRAKQQAELLDLEPAPYLSIKGKGDPSEQPFLERVRSLYATVYTLKFMSKAADQDFTVAKLEGLWSFDESRYAGLTITEAPVRIPRSEWFYQLLIRLPDFITGDQVYTAVQQVISRKRLNRTENVRFITLTEGKVVQMLHVGPFSTEPATLARMQEFMRANGWQRNGLHHEVYLSDFTRTAPEKLRTILREPVRKNLG